MDGSTPAYYFAQGEGDGINRFLFHFQGGGWCYNERECYEAAVHNAPWPPSSTKHLPEKMSYPREYNGGMGYLNYQKENNPLLYTRSLCTVIQSALFLVIHFLQEASNILGLSFSTYESLPYAP